jgi:hypothetical protein
VNHITLGRNDAMNSFIQRHRDPVIGQLNGWDRLRFRGSKRLLCTLGGMMSYLWQIRVLNKEFKDYAMAATEQLRHATALLAESIGQKVEFLASSSVDKEPKARKIARRRGVEEGLIAIFSATEPCISYHMHRDNCGLPGPSCWTRWRVWPIRWNRRYSLK